jgi:hypothetical protein
MADEEILPPEREVLNRLSHALTQVSRGDPLLSLRSELATQFRGIETRFGAIDKATDLQHQDLVRVPTQVDKAIGALREVLEQTLATHIAELRGELHQHISETREKFAAATVLTDKLRIADSTALTAALSAAEKAVGEQNRSSSLAITKSEQGMLEALKQQQVNFQTEIRAITVNLGTMQSRLDRGEGNSNTIYSMAAMMGAILALLIAGFTAYHNGNVQPTVQYVPAPTAVPAPVTVPR